MLYGTWWFMLEYRAKVYKGTMDGSLLVTVGEAAVWQGCSKQTARKYLNAMVAYGKARKREYARRGAVVEYCYIWEPE